MLKKLVSFELDTHLLRNTTNAFIPKKRYNNSHLRACDWFRLAVLSTRITLLSIGSLFFCTQSLQNISLLDSAPESKKPFCLVFRINSQYLARILCSHSLLDDRDIMLEPGLCLKLIC